MTERYFFDTDCLCAFLWVNEESILTKLYARRIFIPAQVYQEIQKVPHLSARIDTLINKGRLSVAFMEVGSEEYYDYIKMTSDPEAGMRIIGEGEAAGIAIAKHRSGILASNNLRDVLPYVQKYGIAHITTGDILIRALHEGIITEDEGNIIWSEMLHRKRKLPSATFSECLMKYR